MSIIINEGFLRKFQISDFCRKLKGLAALGHKAVPGWCSAVATSLDKAGLSNLPQTPPFPTVFPNLTSLVVSWAAEGLTFATPMLILSETLSPQ